MKRQNGTVLTSRSTFETYIRFVLLVGWFFQRGPRGRGLFLFPTPDPSRPPTPASDPRTPGWLRMSMTGGHWLRLTNTKLVG